MSENNQEAPVQEVVGEMLAVNDLDQFIPILSNWHNHQVATVAHLKEVPPGIKIVIGEGAEAKEQLLEGDFRDGFVLGLEMALNYLGKLPFVVEYVDDVTAAH